MKQRKSNLFRPKKGLFYDNSESPSEKENDTLENFLQIDKNKKKALPKICETKNIRQIEDYFEGENHNNGESK